MREVISLSPISSNWTCISKSCSPCRLATGRPSNQGNGSTPSSKQTTRLSALTKSPTEYSAQPVGRLTAGLVHAPHRAHAPDTGAHGLPRPPAAWRLGLRMEGELEDAARSRQGHAPLGAHLPLAPEDRQGSRPQGAAARRLQGPDQGAQSRLGAGRPAGVFWRAAGPNLS